MAGLASLAASMGSKVSTKTKGAFLIGLKEDGSVGGSTRFQYFPETLADSKNVNYQQKEVPGGSLPLYQWISSGERVISFTAVFTSDVDLLAGGAENTESENGRAVGAIHGRLKSQGQLGRNADIRSAIVWLRQYLFPTYKDDKTFAPPHVSLFIPGSGIGAAGGALTLASGPDTMKAVMTQCEVSYDSFFPSGLPRIATVQLSFAQIGQAGGLVTFPAYSDAMGKYVAEGYGADFPGEGGGGSKSLLDLIGGLFK